MGHGAQTAGPVKEARKLIKVPRVSRRKEEPFGQMSPPEGWPHHG